MPQSTSIRLDLRTDPDFKLWVKGRRQTVVLGTDATYIVEAEGFGTFADDVQLGVSNIMEGVSADFAVNPITLSGNTTLTIDTTNLSAGTFYPRVDGIIYTPPQGSITAASCSLTDVQAAINASDSGGTVYVPAGSATWASQLFINKPLLIIGAGIGNTVITNAYVATNTAADHYESCFIVYRPGVPDANHVFRFTGFTLDCDGKAGGIYARPSRSVGNEVARNFRIDHNRVINATGSSNAGAMFRFHGHIVGSVDNNIGENVGVICSVFGGNKDSWTYLTYNHGQADQLYIEDNVITGDLWYLVGSTGAGARTCVRYNTANTTTSRYVGYVDIHGNQTPPYTNHAGLGIEVYNNIWNAGTASGGRFGDYRAGRCMWYGNRIYTTGSAFQAGGNIREEYNDSTTAAPDWNLIDGQPQHVSDCYIWDNVRNTTRLSPSITTVVDYSASAYPCPTHGGTELSPACNCVKYYDAGMASKGVVPRWDVHGWRQTDTFDGSSGMGVGLRSARPSNEDMSGMTAGVAWWATDESKLYRWTGLIWALYYTPYTYPHPLRSDSVLGD